MSMQKSRRLLSIVIVFFWASEYCHVPYFTPYLNMLGFAASAIGIMTGVYGFTQACVRIPLGIVTDITGGYKGVVLMGTVFTTVSSFGLIFAKSAWFIIFCRFLAGVAASTWLAFSVLYSAYYDPEEGVTAMTNINVFNNGGKLLAFVLGTISATIWGYRIPLVCSFLTGVIAIFFALQLKSVPIKRAPMKVSNLIKTLGNLYVLIPALFAVVVQMMIHSTAFSFTSRAAELMGATKTQIGIITALFTVVQVVLGGAVAKHFTSKVREHISVAAGFLCMAVYCVLVGTAAQIWIIYLAQLIGGMGNIILMSVLMALAIKTVPAENKSTAMGLFQAIYGIGMTVGPIAMGYVAEMSGYRVGFVAFAVIGFAAAVLSFIVLKWLENRKDVIYEKKNQNI